MTDDAKERSAKDWARFSSESLSAGDTGQAVFSLYEAWKLDPDYALPLCWLALENGRPDVTVEACPPELRGDFVHELSVRALKERTAVLRFGLGYLYFHAERYHDASEQFRTAVRDEFWRVWSYHFLGLCCGHLGRLEQSIDYLREAVHWIEEEQQMEFLEVLFHLAAAYYQANQFQASMAMLKRLYRLDPDYPDLRQRMSQVAALLGPRGPDGGQAASQALRIP